LTIDHGRVNSKRGSHIIDWSKIRYLYFYI